MNLFHKDTINRDEFQLLIVSTDDFRTVSRKKKFYTRLIDDEMQTFVETTNNLSIRPIPRPFRRGKKKSGSIENKACYPISSMIQFTISSKHVRVVFFFFLIKLALSPANFRTRLQATLIRWEVTFQPKLASPRAFTAIVLINLFRNGLSGRPRQL